MVFKPVGADTVTSLFPTRVMTALGNLFASKSSDLSNQKIVRLTKSQYQALTRAANTLYIISDWGGSSSTISDSFNRSDSSTTLGSTDTGQAWQVLSASAVFGISSNQAYRVTYSGDGENTVAVDSGTSNIDMSVTLSNVSGLSQGGFGPIFRATDSSNFLLVDVTTSGMKLYKRVSGSYTQLASLTGSAPNAGDVIRVVANGTSITVYLNGTSVGTATDSFNQTATKHGMRFAGSTVNDIGVRMDNFQIS